MKQGIELESVRAIEDVTEGGILEGSPHPNHRSRGYFLHGGWHPRVGPFGLLRPDSLLERLRSLAPHPIPPGKRSRGHRQTELGRLLGAFRLGPWPMAWRFWRFFLALNVELSNYQKYF